MAVKMFSLFSSSNALRVKKTAIIRVQYGRLGQVLSAKIKISSGDKDFDNRGIEYINKTSHPDLHHPSKRKGLRLSQWYEMKYEE